MSILNVWISPERALIGVDTKAVYSRAKPGNVLHEYSKMIPLVHASAVLANRGHTAFLSAVFAQCHSHPSEFDSLEGLMPSILDYALNILVTHNRDANINDDSVYGGQELALVGWSPMRRRMVGSSYVKEAGKPGFVRKEINPWIIAPWESSLGSPTIPKTPAAMLDLAKTQMRYVRSRKDLAALGFGGKYIVADLTRDSLSITKSDLEP
jgi:hypothetical protein